MTHISAISRNSWKLDSRIHGFGHRALIVASVVESGVVRMVVRGEDAMFVERANPEVKGIRGALAGRNLCPQRETADRPRCGGGFADYALVSLHCLRIYLDTSHRMTIDLLKKMPQITGEIGRIEADLPAPSTLCKAFDRISMSVCRVLLRQRGGGFASIASNSLSTRHNFPDEAGDLGYEQLKSPASAPLT